MVEDHSRPVFKLHPNQPNNTVVFIIMETNDLSSNLMVCLEHFKAHIDKFSAVVNKPVCSCDQSKEKEPQFKKEHVH